jgi:hypothetical protein
MPRGLDNTFLHYGIRNEDMDLIKALCEKHDLDFDWIKENILLKYHEKKVDVIEISDKDTETVINAALKSIKG